MGLAITDSGPAVAWRLLIAATNRPDGGLVVKMFFSHPFALGTAVGGAADGAGRSPDPNHVDENRPYPEPWFISKTCRTTSRGNCAYKAKYTDMCTLRLVKNMTWRFSH